MVFVYVRVSSQRGTAVNVPLYPLASRRFSVKECLFARRVARIPALLTTQTRCFLNVTLYGPYVSALGRGAHVRVVITILLPSESVCAHSYRDNVFRVEDMWCALQTWQPTRLRLSFGDDLGATLNTSLRMCSSPRRI